MGIFVEVDFESIHSLVFMPLLLGSFSVLSELFRVALQIEDKHNPGLFSDY
jgi:hypothetical protein